MEIFVLDGAMMTGIPETHAYIAKTMRFPEYYGGNLDALADCLGELGPQACVVLMNSPAMEKGLGPYARRLVSVFEDVASAPKSFSWVVCGE